MGYSLKAAREKAREFEELLKNPETRDIREYFRRRAADAAEQLRIQAERALEAEREARAATEHTLRALLLSYCANLKDRGKSSADDVKAKISNHLFKKRPSHSQHTSKPPGGRSPGGFFVVQRECPTMKVRFLSDVHFELGESLASLPSIGEDVVVLAGENLDATHHFPC